MITIKTKVDGNANLINVGAPYYLDQQEQCIYICKLGEDVDKFTKIVGEFISEEISLNVMNRIKDHIEYVHSETLYYKANGETEHSCIPNLVYDMPCKFGELKVGMQLMDEEFNHWKIENHNHQLYVVCPDLIAMEKAKDFDFANFSLIKLEVSENA